MTVAEDRHAELMAALTAARAQAEPVQSITQGTMVPLAFVIAIFSIVGTGIWAASGLSSRVERLEDTAFSAQDAALLSGEMNALKGEIQRLNTFAEKPRFAQEDFNDQIVPVRNLLDRHEDELNKHDDWMDATEDRLRALERQLDQLKAE